MIRLSNGCSKEANCISPLYTSSLSLNEKISYCETLFRQRNIPTIFKITPETFPILIDAELENEGYAKIDITSMQVLDMKNPIPPSNTNIIVYPNSCNQWLSTYASFMNINPELMANLNIMFKKILPKKFFVTLLEGKKAVACGLGVLDNNYLGLYNIIVDSKLRGKGYGEQILLNLLKLGIENGASRSYLQVSTTNIPALHLYRKFGFKEEYKYWYRAKL